MINQEIYEQYKKEVQGYYYKFNTEVLRFHMYKIFDYESLLKTVKNFENFEYFYNYNTKGKEEIIKEHCKQMLNEAINKKLGGTLELVKKCLIVRLGNIYNGMYTENRILEIFSNLAPYIICNKTNKDIDMEYKVDSIIELVGIGKLAIQIKPISYTKYDGISELKHHRQFKQDYGIDVYYVFYKNKDEIRFNNTDINLTDTEAIINEIENILIYN